MDSARRHRSHLAWLAILCGAGAIAACTTARDVSDFGDAPADAGPNRSDAAGGAGFDDFANDGGVPDAATSDGCSDSSKLIYVLDRDGTLRSFDPASATFAVIGTLDCPASLKALYSMAVDRAGNAWVLYQDGNLFKASTKDASCEATSFKAKQTGFEMFGMGFATDSEGGSSETLYVGGYQSHAFGKLALDTMKLTKLGSTGHDVELTGTGSGQLFALLRPAFLGAWQVAEIAKDSGTVLWTKAEPEINEAAQNFAFAGWGGFFYSFVGTGVYRFDPKTAAVTVVKKNLAFGIVGAGVSTCAPHSVVVK